MNVSIRAYARHRGISDTAVRKAIKSGRITTLADGTINVEQADEAWSLNTDVGKQNASRAKTHAVPRPAIEAVEETLKEQGNAPSGTTYMQAKTANEVLKAQTSRLKLQQLKQELVDRSKALSHVFKLARTQRDAWLGWPSRVSAQMAAELNVDPHKMHATLESYVIQHLSELSNIQPRVD